MITDVFPRRNLPGDAEPWGRELENSARSQSYRLANLREAARGSNRATAGQFGVLGRQIDGVAAETLELLSRSTHVIDLDRVTGTLNLPADFQQTSTITSFSVTAPPPADGSVRRAIAFIFGITYNSDTDPILSSSNCDVTIRVNGLASYTMAAPSKASVPPGYLETLNYVVPVEGSSFTVQMLLTGSNGTASAKTVQVGLENLRVVLVYGEKI